MQLVFKVRVPVCPARDAFNDAAVSQKLGTFTFHQPVIRAPSYESVQTTDAMHCSLARTFMLLVSRQPFL